MTAQTLDSGALSDLLDSKDYDIFEGTEQIQQLVIARAISGMHIR